MRRVLFFGGLALWLTSCSNRGNEAAQADTSRLMTNPMDTIDRGYGADGAVGPNTQPIVGDGTGTTTDTGSSGTMGSGGNNGVAPGGAAASGGGRTTADTNQRRR